MRLFAQLSINCSVILSIKMSGCVISIATDLLGASRLFLTLSKLSRSCSGEPFLMRDIDRERRFYVLTHRFLNVRFPDPVIVEESISFSASG